jgi:hypothetical protein
MKRYNVMMNVGCVRYLVSFHDGVKTHKDGSPFYDIACISSKVKMAQFIKSLVQQGYVCER